MLPREKFVLLSRFIDEAIEPRHDKINEPIIKLKRKKIILSKDKLIKIQASGIENKNGI